MQRVPPFSYSIFIVRYKTGRDYRVWVFFGTVRFFFLIFFVSKGPPSSFLIFYSKLKFQKAQKVSPFKFFGTMRLAQNSYFSFSSKNPKGPPFTFSKSLSFWALDMAPTLDVPVLFRLKLGFLKIYPQILFFNTIRNFDVISGIKCYIRIFDVISELYCVLLRWWRRFENRCFSCKRPTHILTTVLFELWIYRRL